jgi:hypothetical protein
MIMFDYDYVLCAFPASAAAASSAPCLPGFAASVQPVLKILDFDDVGDPGISDLDGDGREAFPMSPTSRSRAP